MPRIEQTISYGTKSVVPVTVGTIPVYSVGGSTPTITDSIYRQVNAATVQVLAGKNFTTTAAAIDLIVIAPSVAGNFANDYGIVIGGGAMGAIGVEAIAIGKAAAATNTRSIGIGSGVGATGNTAIAIGYQASAGFQYSQAYGDHAVAQNANEVVFGGADEGTGRLNYVTRFRIIPAIGLPIKHESGASGWAVYQNGDASKLLFQVLNNGEFSTQQLGRGFSVKEGANGRQGFCTMVAGVVTVPVNTISANAKVFFVRKTPAGGLGNVTQTQIVNTSFTLTSSDATETSTFSYFITEPA